MALHAHDPVEAGTPFYAATPSPLGAAPGAPAMHKFDRSDFVPRFIAEVASAESASTPPPSQLGRIAPLGSGVPDFDTDALDCLGGRFRKLYQPVHFRFYLAACELRCRVPGFPAPDRKKVKKVELVVRRVAIRANHASANGPPTVESEREWAWVTVPEPSAFPAGPAGTDGPPEATLALAPRITGNTHTWWPVPKGEAALEGEQRFPMSRAFAPGLEKRAVYFGFLPLASGEMYGPRPVPKVKDPKPDPGKPPVALVAASVVPLRPLVPAPSRLPLSLASMRAWRASWQTLLGLFTGSKVNGPRPKFESPPLWVDVKKTPLRKQDGSLLQVKDKKGNVIDPRGDEPPLGGWAYVVRCVATVDEGAGCVLETWTGATEPAVIAPHYDPFGGRPTQIDLPSLTGMAKMLGGLGAAQVAQRGGNNFGVKHAGGNIAPIDKTPKMGLSIGGGICFFGIPLFTITAYLMFSIALILLLPVLAILLALKFCIPPVEVDLEIN